jgi:hypothetical protein
MRCPSPNQWACAVQRQLWELESHAPVLGIPWLSVDLLAVEAAVGAGAEEWMTGGGRGGSCRAGGFALLASSSKKHHSEASVVLKLFYYSPPG